MIKQRTIAEVVKATGVGLHKGEKVTITLRPASANTGIVFRRVDLDPVVDFETTPEAVGDTQLCTCLTNKDGVRLSTTEHLIAAVAALGIDNLIVELDSAEVPIMDGSALPFIYLLQKGGIAELNVAKRFIRIKETVRVEEGDKWAEIEPYDGFHIDFEIAFDHPAINASRQRIGLDITAQSFTEEISRARTFGFMKDIEYMHANNLALGGSMDNAVVLDDFKVLNPNGLRYKDEFVKHKILDCVGDLFMTGHNILGKVTCYKSGHGLNNKLLREVMANEHAWEWVTFDEPVTMPAPGLEAAQQVTAG
ncbi:UDP-3-O-acyl-N-acetylglucosamine deacetylase [Pseudoalteromonas luteoviolacea]|uniref:UDP-3-O-acyl-N-acetylglucosamine deacetylase n=1 Tax=Pseudoalteromonas luteoviolacea H33 TaxID=1365251 RepID=A0A167EYC5_9GAMM|nr:UDP-3-O-acyl-N-acetylglucosamine deacetylase [Pseudoalteromonas luteoviolacea]KZN51360.1 UDP-3-O-(3-hydroxymyristoyl) glucosamine N-acyltransferase [Pseudoalteromonas luteoviolacea H33]KZN71470.1 UDP-3-O-(3-hydroxymyristoyl) glucosamine N-acyltransferase [Pseudoalteromonas luteoviolacea H33-S]MBQ4876824.1 UDP-3-O-acyl-N-acetylglucosamine deacetylase [Pseudoalteromonas luteoviolacea]MBQ4905387.1 UDP-3-O-acyl-N-acetylglucosamine deacetylase [Pseudoalteromonas luteoviolacea]